MMRSRARGRAKTNMVTRGTKITPLPDFLSFADRAAATLWVFGAHGSQTFVTLLMRDIRQMCPPAESPRVTCP